MIVSIKMSALNDKIKEKEKQEKGEISVSFAIMEILRTQLLFWKFIVQRR